MLDSRTLSYMAASREALGLMLRFERIAAADLSRSGEDLQEGAGEGGQGDDG